MSLQALASSLQRKGLVATCYVCGDGQEGQGASFVADLGDTHTIRFLVSDCGISWVESRNGHELVRLDGADAIQELQRVTAFLQQVPASGNAIKTADQRQAVLISAASQPLDELVG